MGGLARFSTGLTQIKNPVWDKSLAIPVVRSVASDVPNRHVSGFCLGSLCGILLSPCFFCCPAPPVFDRHAGAIWPRLCVVSKSHFVKLFLNS